MRILFLLSFILTVSLNVFSQDQRVPSQKQIQSQMKQAKTEAQQQITDMENEIAEAKKRGDDPESIQQMEKNLATLKKMLGVIDNAASVNRNKRPEITAASNTVAPYKSPYIHFFNQAVATPTEAQAKDRLLWYRGKKFDKNTLITTKGRVVRYDRQNNQVLVQYNEKKDTNIIKLIANLKKSRQWTNNYVNREAARKNNFFDYPLVMMTMREFDLIEQDYNRIVNNTIQLPGTGANLMVFTMPAYLNETGSTGPNLINEPWVQNSSELDWLEQTHQELLNLMKNPPPLDFPPPPKHEFDLCYYCDTSRQSQYYKEKSAWSSKFTEYEVKLISTSLSIERQFELLGADINNSAIPNLEADIDKALDLGFKRIDQKVELLKQRYSHDIYRQEAVVTMILSVERQKELLGAANENIGPPDLNFLKEFDQYLEQRIAARDYNVVFNYSMILSHERQKELLGAIDDQNAMDLVEEVWKLNHFALTVNIDFDIQYEPEESKPNLIANGHLSTAQKIYVSLGKATDCKWQLYKYDPDYGDPTLSQQETLFKIPLKVNGGIKKVLRDQHWVTYPYSGPIDLEMNFPIFKISFCPNTGSDSALLDVIRYTQESTLGDAANAYTTDLLAYLDKILGSIEKTKANQDEVIDISDQMMTIQNQATVDNPTGYAKLDEMQVKYKMNGIQHDFQKNAAQATRVSNAVILFDAQNGSQFLINAKTDTGGQRDLTVIKVNSGIIQLKVVLEPL